MLARPAFTSPGAARSAAPRAIDSRVSASAPSTPTSASPARPGNPASPSTPSTSRTAAPAASRVELGQKQQQLAARVPAHHVDQTNTGQQQAGNRGARIGAAGDAQAGQRQRSAVGQRTRALLLEPLPQRLAIQQRALGVRRTAPVQHQGGPADADHVAGGQQACPVHALAVDQGAVVAVEIRDADVARRHHQPGMPARHHRIRQRDVHLLPRPIRTTPSSGRWQTDEESPSSTTRYERARDRRPCPRRRRGSPWRWCAPTSAAMLADRGARHPTGNNRRVGGSCGSGPALAGQGVCRLRPPDRVRGIPHIARARPGWHGARVSRARYAARPPGGGEVHRHRQPRRARETAVLHGGPGHRPAVAPERGGGPPRG